MANSYDIGDSVELRNTFTDSNGTVADPTAVTVKYEDPSGNQTTLVYGVDAAVVKQSTGVYTVNVTVDEAGTWAYRFVGTGDIIAAAEAYFYVRHSEF